MKRFLILVFTLMALSVACGGNEKVTEEVIYEDDVLRATNLGITDAGILTVKLENRTDDEITVLPMDSSVDDNMVQFTSGMLASIKGGKSYTQGWALGGKPKEKVEFVLSVFDENMHELMTTDVITINVK